MPKDKRHKQKRTKNPESANSYFETAEELTGRRKKSGSQSQQQWQQSKQTVHNPEKPKQ